jgi:hypothetical protein
LKDNVHKQSISGSAERATQVFRQLFIYGTPLEVAREVERIKTGQSNLDGVRDQARSLAHNLGPAERLRLDLMLTSICEAEHVYSRIRPGCSIASHRSRPSRSPTITLSTRTG